MKTDPKYFYLERLIWVTGLSASGKTTIADILGKNLTQKNFKVLRLDGDQLREALKNCENMSKYDPASRLKNALTYSALAKSLISQFDYIIVSTISMFGEIYKINRKIFTNYFEVYLDIPLSERSLRDPRGFYKSYQTSTAGEFFCESSKVDIPTEAHFTYDNNPNFNAHDVAQKVEVLSHQHFEKILRG